MRRLPPIWLMDREAARAAGELDSKSGQGLTLPCPAADLIQLATTLGRDPFAFADLLRQNPSLLLFAITARFSAVQEPATSLEELASWCESHLLNWFDSQPPGWSDPLTSSRLQESTFNDLTNFFTKWKKVHRHKSIRKRLVNWLQLMVGWDKRESKAWVRQVVGKRFSFCVESNLSLPPSKKVVAAWLTDDQSLSASLDLESVFQLRFEHHRLAARFEERLHQEKMASLKQLAYGASHEINNPLANISTRAQTLLADESNPERRHKLAMIYEQALRAHEMISDLMLFANPPAINPEWVDVRLWLARMIHEVSPLLTRISTTMVGAKAPSIELIVRVSPTANRMQADAGQLAVAFKSLIRNSVEAIGGRATCVNTTECNSESGTIEVRIFTDCCGGILFEVIDDGVGVSESARKHLFDPFFSSREAGRGLGFGLSKAWRIAEMHGGSLAYDPSHSPGAKFVLRVPLGQI